MPTEILSLILALVLGYLSGSIPFGLILTQAAGMGDIRSIGSGNIGATNVLRTGNRPIAAATLVLDALKAVAPILIARYFWGEDAARFAALGAFLGHCFPAWIGFKGGKGVAVEVKLRSASQPASARLYSNPDGSGRVVLDTPQHGIARGQAAVFYAPGESTRVLGGGWITGTEERAEAA